MQKTSDGIPVQELHLKPHPHSLLLTELYRGLASTNPADVAAAIQAGCADACTFQVPGKSPLAGKYTRSTMGEWMTRARELSAGSYQFEVHDILSSDQHSTVLLTEKVKGPSGAMAELRMVHVWRFGGETKPVAGYAYPRDLYQYDQAWGAKI